MVELRYRGRVITSEDILYIRELIAAHPGESRRTLSRNCAKPGSGGKPTARCATWCAAACCCMLDRAGQIDIAAGELRAGTIRWRTEPRPAPVLIDTTPIEGRCDRSAAAGVCAGAAHAPRSRCSTA